MKFSFKAYIKPCQLEYQSHTVGNASTSVLLIFIEFIRLDHHYNINTT